MNKSNTQVCYRTRDVMTLVFKHPDSREPKNWDCVRTEPAIMELKDLFHFGWVPTLDVPKCWCFKCRKAWTIAHAIKFDGGV